LIDDKPIGATLNRNLGSPTAPGEAVESELDRLITRRHDQRVKDEGERQLEEAWRERERERERASRGGPQARGEPGRLAVVVSVPGARLPGAGGGVWAEGRRPDGSNREKGNGMTREEIRAGLGTTAARRRRR
jgi:hypothetical protein